jgi:hypothetical protein
LWGQANRSLLFWNLTAFLSRDEFYVVRVSVLACLLACSDDRLREVVGFGHGWVDSKGCRGASSITDASVKIVEACSYSVGTHIA